MDSENILLEQMNNDDIDTSFVSPILSLMIYIVIIYYVFSMYVDDNITNLFIVIIVWFTFNSYKRDFEDVMKILCY